MQLISFQAYPCFDCPVFTSAFVTSEIIATSKVDWELNAGQDIFLLEYERFFTSTLTKSMDCFFAVIPTGRQEAHAFVEVISSQGARKTKLMNVTVHPSYLPLDNPSTQNSLVKLYFSAIRATFDLADDHETSEVKIFGRSDHLLRILITTSGLLDQDPLENYNHVIQGRWLTFYSKSS